MNATRARSLLAAIAAAAVLGYGLAGHAVPQMSSHDGMAGAAAGLCLLLTTAIGCFLVTPRQAGPNPLWAKRATTPLGQPRQAPAEGRARASPIKLQRFLN